MISRYRDAPGRALKTPPAILYLIVNTASSLAALALTRAFGWTFGVGSGHTDTAAHWTQVLVAGFGAMALLRSALFSVRVGNRDLALGLSTFLQIVLDAADRAVDRDRAQERDIAVRRVMAGISFAKAQVALPTYCLNLMQNLPQEDQQRLARQIADLARSDMGDVVKARNLGLLLMNVVGEGVLTQAVESLKHEIKQDEAVDRS